MLWRGGASSHGERGEKERARDTERERERNRNAQGYAEGKYFPKAIDWENERG